MAGEIVNSNRTLERQDLLVATATFFAMIYLI